MCALCTDQGIDAHTYICVKALVLLDGLVKTALGEALVAHDVFIFGGPGRRICFQIGLQGGITTVGLWFPEDGFPNKHTGSR